jgi:phosphatidylglycerol lysyltransferase
MKNILDTPTSTEIEFSRKIVMQYGWNTMAYQILNPGMALWFSQKCEGVVGYAETKTHYIIAGSPISKGSDLPTITAEFFSKAQTNGKKVCFFGAQERIADILSTFTPISTILLGAQPVWSPNEWLANVNLKQSLRAQLQRAKNKHILATVVENCFEIIYQELQNCLNEWISTRHLPSMHFLVEPNTLDKLDDRILVVAKRDNRIVGFCIASPIPLRNGWLIEQIVRSKEAPNGTAELLLHTIVKEIQKRNAKFITLGLSPLSKHYQPQHSQPIWLHFLLQSLRIYGRVFYNFKGLDSFKAKFQPTMWEPVFAITNEKNPSLSTLYAIATAFTMISPVKFVAKGIVKYIEQIINRQNSLLL